MTGGDSNPDRGTGAHDPCKPPPPDPCLKAGKVVTCEQCVEFLLDYVDGVLPTDQRATFDAHLAACPDCTVYLANYMQAATLAGNAGRAERRATVKDVPAALVEAILKSLKGL